ncbi:MAG: sensor domain-containing diguanylate cyclase [Rhodospirillaceae bacterium]|nr:sensor domain-containing diguanylate cyclase [Rhodospirillaceae bacterium]
MVVAVAVSVMGGSARADSINITDELDYAIGKHAFFLQESDTPLSLEEATKAFAAGRFSASDQSILNFGIGAPPAWIAFNVINQDASPIRRQLSVETSWIDLLDVAFIRNGVSVEQFTAGDSLPFTSRQTNSNYFEFNHDFANGITTVMIRAATVDPMVLPIYFTNSQTAQSRKIFHGYSYGAVYGVIVALLAYNLLLFIGIRNSRYILYSNYLFWFLFMNSTYSGHSFRWFWPESVNWQLWSNPVLMMVFSFSGLFFSVKFLQTSTHFPNIYRVIIGGIIAYGTMMAASIAAGGHEQALLLSFSLIFVFPATMVLLGIISVSAGVRSAKYYLLASVCAAAGYSITGMSVWGFIPHHVAGYRAAEIGMMLDAILLALALTDQFRIVQRDKMQALVLSQVDPLTGVNNRRAFFDFSQPLWDTGVRNNHDMSVILLDIDGFKTINDNYGHSFGDEALVKVAKLIKKSARTGDIVARWGGEEFIVFLPETDLTEAKSAAERICSGIAGIELKAKGQDISITASLGVACRDATTTSLESLIYHADVYLYSAKDQGRNRVCSKLVA